MARREALLAVCLLAAGLAGCLGDAGGPDATPEANGSGDTQAPADPGARVGVLGQTEPEVPLLGLMTFQAVPEERVAPHVPGGMEPVPCFLDTPEDTVDAALAVTEERYAALPGGHGPGEARSIALIACAERPEGLAREDANEPPWVQLMAWSQGEAYRASLAEHGYPVPEAHVELAEQPGGFAFAAETPDGTPIVEGRLTEGGVGAPLGPAFSCEPQPFDGRSVTEGADGRLGALDWNKTETPCPAAASVAWPADGAIADVLGPERTPDTALNVHVQEAEFVWRTLVEGG